MPARRKHVVLLDSLRRLLTAVSANSLRSNKLRQLSLCSRILRRTAYRLLAGRQHPAPLRLSFCRHRNSLFGLALHRTTGFGALLSKLCEAFVIEMQASSIREEQTLLSRRANCDRRLHRDRKRALVCGQGGKSVVRPL